MVFYVHKSVHCSHIGNLFVICELQIIGHLIGHYPTYTDISDITCGGYSAHLPHLFGSICNKFVIFGKFYVMASLGVSKGLLLMKGGGEEDIAKLLAERKKKNATPDSAKIAKEKDMEAIYSNKARLDSMVSANRKQWVNHVKDLDATSRIVRKN